MSITTFPLPDPSTSITTTGLTPSGSGAGNSGPVLHARNGSTSFSEGEKGISGGGENGRGSLPPGAAYAPGVVGAGAGSTAETTTVTNMERRTLSQDQILVGTSSNGMNDGTMRVRSLTEPIGLGLETRPAPATRPSLPLPRPPLPTPPSLLPPSLPPIAIPSDEAQDQQEEEVLDTLTPAPTRRPSLPLPTPTPTRSQSPPSADIRSPTPINDDQLLTLQFSPVASVLPAAPSSTNSPPLKIREQRNSNIPSFVPAPAFSPSDRGPYPPHQQRQSMVKTSPPILRDRDSNASYFNPGINIMSMEGPYPNMNLVKGKQRDSDEVDINRRASKFYNTSIAVTRDEAAINGTAEQQRNSMVRGTSFDLPGGGGDMVGIGRNSIIRPNGTLSPTFSNQLLGPAPQSPGINNTNPSKSQQQPLPPHLVPQPEICVECMMRDRDMIDVDVTGLGVWERESDQDWEEAIRCEMSHEGDFNSGNSEESSRRGSGSRESAGPKPRKRIGKGMMLTENNLKVWTNMNPPASSHRWRTLQTFLATQNHLLELERHAHESTLLEKERMGQQALCRGTDRQSAPALLSATMGRPRTSTVLPNGLVVEKINVDKDEKQFQQARSRGVSQNRDAIDRSSYHQRQAGANAYPSPAPSVAGYATGDQPWLSNQSRRFSSPALKDGRPSSTYTTPSTTSIKKFSLGKFARSSSDLRSIASPRSISPGRGSIGGRGSGSERPGSMWSRFSRRDTQSVYSFAPSGSMMDMHLGLSMDKHQMYAPYETYPSMSDAAVARHVDYAQEKERDTERKPKKKGIKGFFSKLIQGSDGKKRHAMSASEPNTPYVQHEEDDDYPLAPPPPLSALANEPRYHQRSLSNSSVDSVGGPFTPPAHPRAVSASLSPVPSRNSFQRPSNDYLAPEPSPPRNPSLLQRTDSPEQFYPVYDSEQQAEILDSTIAHGGVRKEKSLPALPSDFGPGSHPPLPFNPNMPYLNGQVSRSAYSIRTPSLSPSLRGPNGAYYAEPNGIDYDDVGGGRKSKARNKVWSMGFGFGNGRKKMSSEEDRAGEPAIHPGTLNGIQREGALVSVRF